MSCFGLCKICAQGTAKEVVGRLNLYEKVVPITDISSTILATLLEWIFH